MGSGPVLALDANSTYEQASLYDEHTWGAYASVAAPHDPWTKGQENAKAGYAFRASASAHDMLAKAAGKVARSLGEGAPGGRFNLGDLTPEEAYPLDEPRGVLALNTLPWARQLIVDEPRQRGGAAPVGVLDMFFLKVSPGEAETGDRPANPPGGSPGLGLCLPSSTMAANGGVEERPQLVGKRGVPHRG